MNDSYFEEKRLFPRLLFKEKALLISPDFLGLVKDISLGGLSFTYCDQVADPHTLAPLEITMAHDSLVLNSSFFQIIDNETPDGFLEPSGTVKLCRVSFNGLAGPDIMRLWDFMREHCWHDHTATAPPASSGLYRSGEASMAGDCAYSLGSAA